MLVCVHVHMSMGIHMPWSMWESEDNPSCWATPFTLFNIPFLVLPLSKPCLVLCISGAFPVLYMFLGFEFSYSHLNCKYFTHWIISLVLLHKFIYCFINVLKGILSSPHPTFIILKRIVLKDS